MRRACVPGFGSLQELLRFPFPFDERMLEGPGLGAFLPMESRRGLDMGISFPAGHFCSGRTPGGRPGRTAALEGRCPEAERELWGVSEWLPSFSRCGGMQDFSLVFSLRMWWGYWQCTQDRVEVPMTGDPGVCPIPACGHGASRASLLGSRGGRPGPGNL